MNTPQDDLKDHSEDAGRARPKIMLLGVGHVFDLRDAVRGSILQVRPDIVALELDPARFHALLSKKLGERKGGVPIVYRILGRLQKSLAEQYGSEVGSEMITAAETAQETGARVALIDMDAVNIFSRIRGTMTLKEKLSMLFGMFLSLFARKSTIEKELRQYSSNEEKYLQELQRVYPSTVKILIDERNEHMVARLRGLSSEFSNILVIVGDGHISGMSQMLSDFADVEVLRLHELRSAPGENNQFLISYSIEGDGINY